MTSNVTTPLLNTVPHTVTNTVPNYLNPDIAADLALFDIPIIEATPESLKGYGYFVDDPATFDIEITRWPARGWRQVDEDTGDEGGVTEGTFISTWKGDYLFGHNKAVDGHYIIGYNQRPEIAVDTHNDKPSQLLLWHANFHPDGGQMFYPKSNQPFLLPLALPGDDVKPQDFVCFYFSGERGAYIHADIWHEGVFAIAGEQEFADKQGAVHARVSVDFGKEFNCLLRVDLTQLPK